MYAARTRGSQAFPHGGAGPELARWLEETGAAPGQIGVAIETPHAGRRGVARRRLRGPRHRSRPDPRLPAPLCLLRGQATAAMPGCSRAPCAPTPTSSAASTWSPLVLQLRERTRTLNELTRQRTRFCHDPTALWRLPPTARRPPQPVDPSLVRALEPRTPAQALKLRVSTLAKLLKKHGIRRLTAARLREILITPALTVAPGAAEAASRALATLFAQAHATNQLLAQAQHEVRELLKAFSQAHAADDRPDDLTILLSIPGVGLCVASTLFAEAYDLLRRRDYPALRARSGVAPVSIQSGNSRWEIRRLAVQHELRNALYHWARVAVLHDPLSRARYRALRARGYSHGRALRTVGDRLLAVACAMLRAGTLYDPKLSRDKVKVAA